MATKTYRPNEARQLSDRELRREYARLRRVANKRLANLEKRDLGNWGERRFGSARGMSSEYVEAALLEVSAWLREPRHTVRGAEQQMNAVIDSFKERGIDFVNRDNFRQFTDFMNGLREQYSEKLFDSSDALEVFGNMERLGLDPEEVKNHFDYYAQNADKLSRLRVPRSDKGKSYQEIRRKIRRLK